MPNVHGNEKQSNFLIGLSVSLFLQPPIYHLTPALSLPPTTQYQNQPRGEERNRATRATDQEKSLKESQTCVESQTQQYTHTYGTQIRGTHIRYTRKEARTKWRNETRLGSCKSSAENIVSTVLVPYTLFLRLLLRWCHENK